MLDEIVRNGAISDTSLRMLVKKIIITERKGKLKIKIQLNADFSTHIDFLHTRTIRCTKATEIY